MIVICKCKYFPRFFVKDDANATASKYDVAIGVSFLGFCGWVSAFGFGVSVS